VKILDFVRIFLSAEGFLMWTRQFLSLTVCFRNLSLPQGRQFLVATNQQSVKESPLQYRTLKNALVKRYDHTTFSHVLFTYNGGLRSTFDGNIALLAYDVIDFAVARSETFGGKQFHC